MPPHIPRKRLRDQSSALANAGPSKGKAKTEQARKPTLFDDLDGLGTSSAPGRANSGVQRLDDIGDDDSSLSSLSDGDFEDVPAAKRQKLAGSSNIDEDEEEDDDDDDSEDEDIVFEDVETPHVGSSIATATPRNLELTLIKDTRLSLINQLGDKKGPSKRERLVRNATHCMHVQSLMWHNAVRNSWLCDPEVQGLLVSHLPPSLWDEVERWRRNSGLEVAQEPTTNTPTHHGAKRTKPSGKDARDWGAAAQRLEKGAVDMSHGDPLFRLMKALSAWWKKRFTISAPGLRKVGYMSLERLDHLTKAFEQGNRDLARFGEKIASLAAFRRHAQHCSGSRDVGAQLFTALLRGLGLEARMVTTLQPLGFGWNKMEDADPEKDSKTPDGVTTNGVAAIPTKPTTTKSSPRRKTMPTTQNIKRHASTQSDDLELTELNSDDELAVEMPPPGPKNAVKYDKDLLFPHYWAEILSPATNKYLAVDALVKPVIATNRELVESLEPRGSKADKARQVMCYVVGFSQDGTAKDVTVRYLKRQTFPGRTKGVRMPIEKVPIYDKHGKVKRYEQFDWFKAVMRCYGRGTRQHPITEVDDEEDSTDLRPVKPAKKEVREGEETLQYYKQSKDFVLERHLKREEALLPDAPPVKVFRTKGKGSDAIEENVYLRKDVVNVKSMETWHKEGRAPIEGETPLKRVPYRAATTNRRREIAEAERATGEKVLQGLYSFDQTDWIIPPPIQNGIIPKNEYGNIDLFVEHMCPQGAVHVPYRGAMRVSKRMGIDFAEAVVDFEFGHRMAVPVIQGVVIAEEYHDELMAELAKDEAERSRKEDEKRRKAAVGMWRKMLMGLRIVERIWQDHGEINDDEDVFGRRQPAHQRDASAQEKDEAMAGGFLPEGFVEEDEDEANETSTFFPVVHGDDPEELIVGHDALDPPHLTLNSKAGDDEPRSQAAPSEKTRRRRRKMASPPDEKEDDDLSLE